MGHQYSYVIKESKQVAGEVLTHQTENYGKVDVGETWYKLQFSF
jgi:hypothetical protein